MRLHLATVLAVCIAGGCASRQPDDGAAADARRHLITPPGDDDVTALSDGMLDRRIELTEAQVNTLMRDASIYAAQFTGGDLTADAGYRSLLTQMKSAETELGRLEDERDRRRSAKAD